MSTTDLLIKEKETLLIPLYGKAIESQRPNPILSDPKAEAILAQLDYEFGDLKVPPKTSLMLAMRAKKLDTLVQQFVAQHPEVCVLHLGCGLDSRVERVNLPQVPWYDLDFPEVIDLRRHFYQERDSYRMLGSSVLDFGWMEAVEQSGPAIIIAEGLMMYLHEAEVRALILRLRERFPGSELAFDVFSRTTVSRMRQHPSLQKTGAEVHWGIDDPQEIERWAAGIRLLEEWPFTASPDIANLGWGYRLMFKLAGLFRAARTAHRILRYQL